MADATVRREARAKINVFLRVLGRRPDGYHDLESLVVPISLADTVTVRASTRVSVAMEAAGTMEFEPIEPRRNLALRAAEEWIRARGEPGEAAEVHVEKRIPVAAGMGGGSADAAAVLLAMNEVWGSPMSHEDLLALGARLGSDVPALLAEGPVVMRGRGEIVEPAEVATTWWVLVPQPFPVSTTDAYRWWDEDEGATGPDPGPALEAMASGSLSLDGSLVFNDLEGAVTRRHPEIGQAKEALIEAGVIAAVMCGSGPSVAGFLPNGMERLAKDAEDGIEEISGRPVIYAASWRE